MSDEQHIRHEFPEFSATVVEAERDRMTVERDRIHRGLRLEAFKAAVSVFAAGDAVISDDEHDDLFAFAERVEMWLGRDTGSSVWLVRPDDEHLEVVVNGRVVATANHDEHGWDGMQAVEATAVAVARVLGGSVADEPGSDVELDGDEDVDVHDPAHETSAPPA